MRCLYEVIENPSARDTNDVEEIAGSHRSPLMNTHLSSSCPSRGSITWVRSSSESISVSGRNTVAAIRSINGTMSPKRVRFASRTQATD
jgi:hypothetical protein